jgi:hypothetical protein
MPMHVFRNVCVVHNFYGYRLAFAHPQQGARDLIAVADGAEHNPRSQLDHHRCDAQAEIRRVLGGVRMQGRRLRMLRWSRSLLEAWRLSKHGPQLSCPSCDYGSPSQPCKLPTFQSVLIPAQIGLHSVTRSCGSARHRTQDKRPKSRMVCRRGFRSADNS